MTGLKNSGIWALLRGVLIAAEVLGGITEPNSHIDFGWSGSIFIAGLYTAFVVLVLSFLGKPPPEGTGFRSWKNPIWPTGQFAFPFWQTVAYGHLASGLAAGLVDFAVRDPGVAITQNAYLILMGGMSLLAIELYVHKYYRGFQTLSDLPTKSHEN